MVPTASTTPAHEGLAAVVKTAAARPGEEQPPPTAKGEVLLTDKAAAENADRARFAFVGLENFIDVDELAMVAGSGTHVYKAKKSGKNASAARRAAAAEEAAGEAAADTAATTEKSRDPLPPPS